MHDLGKWRAEAVTHALWKVAHEKRRWQGMRKLPPHFSGRTSEHPQPRVSGSAYLPVTVRQEKTNIETHRLRLWRSDYLRVTAELEFDEYEVWTGFLATPRHSAIFRWHKGKGVERGADVEPDLAEVALRIAACCEVVKSGPASC